MTVEEFISTAPFVSITNAELVEITWLCELIQENKHALEQLKETLTSFEALYFKATPEQDLTSIGSYKILSSAHGWFIGSDYEHQAFIQVCIDHSQASCNQYALLAIAEYDGGEHSRVMIEKYQEHLNLKDRLG